MTEKQIEKQIVEKGLTSPRITPDMIDDCIKHEQYHVFPDTTLTVCALTLKNGYQVVGESACVTSKNFDAGIGRKIARENARGKIWALEGYLLRSQVVGSITTWSDVNKDNYAAR
jgi:hypothetical protein